MTITYQAVVDVSARSVELLAPLLRAERVRRGTRTGTRALGVHQQALGVLRWFFDDVRMVALAQDNTISRSAVSAYRDEGIAVLAARRPSLHGALLAATAAGPAPVIVDGTLIDTDRLSTPGPPREGTCGGAARTTVTAATSRSWPLPTAGRGGPAPSSPAVSTT